MSIELSERILTVRFARPECRNALNQPMYAALAHAFNAAGHDEAVRVVLLAGQADCFTSGNDMLAPTEGLDSAVGGFAAALMGCAKPVLAAPSGMAIGIGLTMLLHCDLVFCGEQTLLRAPFVSLGVCPELGASYMLPQIMGHQRACELLLTGAAIAPARACEYGLVNAVLPNAQVEAHARDVARLIAQQAPAAVRNTKQMMRNWQFDHVAMANEVEMACLMAMKDGPEALEARAAFAQRRAADFSRFG